MPTTNISFRPLSIIKRYLIKSGKKPVRVPIGLFRGLILELDLQSEMQIYLGLWEQETHSIIRRAANRCKWAVDIGAGKGELCLYLLRNSSVSAVVAADPNPTDAGTFAKNLRLNALSDDHRLTLHQCTVGTRFGDISLDEIGTGYIGRGFIKIDVDGLELEVLQSGDALLGAADIELLIETHSIDLERECIRWLNNRGYHCRIISNALWRLVIPENRSIAHNRWLWATKK